MFSYFNFHPLEVVSRYRDPQLQVGENYSYFLNFRSNICKSLCLKTHVERIRSLYNTFSNTQLSYHIVAGCVVCISKVNWIIGPSRPELEDSLLALLLE